MKIIQVQKSILVTSMLVALYGCGSGSSSDSNTPSINPPAATNTAPSANAGQDQAVETNTNVTLNASASSDAENDSLTYQWSIVSQPAGSTATLSNSESVSSTFTPTVAGAYEVSLVVNDGALSSSEDTVTITVSKTSSGNTNTAPTANAGMDQTVSANTQVNLSANTSSDPEDDALTYTWNLQNQPANSNITLANINNVNTSFTPSISGTYVIALTVNDGELDSAQDSVSITVEAAASQSTDITDAEFTNRAGSCANYAGDYFANVKDIKRNMGFEGSINISLEGNKCRFVSNEIPNHDFNDNSASFATNVSTQSADFELPITPTMATQVTELALGVTNAIMLNGVEVDILPAACYGVGGGQLGKEKIGCGGDQIDNPWRYDPMSPLNGFGTDMHNAHTQPSGKYHYHGNPLAMFNIQCEASAEASPVIGFAADGFPVYGPCFTDPASGTVRKATSSYGFKDNGGPRQNVAGYTTPVGGVGDIESNNYDGQFRGDYQYNAGSGDLDECNGMTIDGQYGYYVTDSFPWIIGCYKGTVDNSFINTGQRLQKVLHSHGDSEPHTH